MTKQPTKAIFSLMAALFFCMGIYAQEIGSLKIQPPPKPKNHYVLLGVLGLLSGGADGLRDAVLFHPDAVISKLGVSQSFWGAESWKRKYKNGDPAQGAKFPGSTGLLVFITDAPHALKFSQNLFTAGAVAIQITGTKQKWWVYIVRGLAYWTVQRIGFSLVYYRF